MVYMKGREYDTCMTSFHIFKSGTRFNSGYFAFIRHNDATTWVELESIMLSEISQSEKDKYHMISLTCGI